MEIWFQWTIQYRLCGTLIDWNIVQMGHNINSGNKDITLLG
jgi:hypothetical protein